MSDKIGPSFASELSAAGVALAVGWDQATGELTRCFGISDADFARAKAVLAKHDPSKPGPVVLPMVSGDALIGSLSDDQAAKISVRDLARLAVRSSVPASNAKLKRIATVLKTTPDALLVAAAS